MMRASARASVKYRRSGSVPSSSPSVVVAYQAESVRYDARSPRVGRPSEEVAYWSQVFPAPPIKREEEAMVERPVPPRVAVSVPVVFARSMSKVEVAMVPTYPVEPYRRPVKDPMARLVTLVFWREEEAVVEVARTVLKRVASAVKEDAYRSVVVAAVPVARVKVMVWKSFVPPQTLSVVVPKARVSVRSAERSPPPWSGYVVLILRVERAYEPAGS